MGAEKTWHNHDRVFSDNRFDLPLGERNFLSAVQSQAGFMDVETHYRNAEFFEMECQKCDGMNFSRRPKQIEGSSARAMSRVSGESFELIRCSLPSGDHHNEPFLVPGA